MSKAPSPPPRDGTAAGDRVSGHSAGGGDPTAEDQAAGGDRAPGGAPAEEPGSLLTYTVGFAFAVLLTAASFTVAQTDLLWAPGLGMGLAVLAIAQMGVHLVFFLHMSSGPDNTNNVLALAFGVLIVTLVVGGSLWIMANLNGNMMPTSTMMEMSR
jgi:cytochrome o ubiquinol oxidase operon protein cyoD